MAQPYEPVADAELTPDSDSLMRRENDENQRTALEETDSLLTVMDHNHETIVYEAATASGAVANQESVLELSTSESSEYGDYDSGIDDHDRHRDSLASVTSSIIAGIEEYGRVYQDTNLYPLPRDNKEKDRLDFDDGIFCANIMDGKLYHAPLDKLHDVLDVGTGTGIWAINFAEKHPEADVLGIDISPIQPEKVPPNCAFQIDNLEQQWNFNKRFDLVHIRNPTGFKSFNNVVENAYQYLNTGGWLEIQDVMFPLHNDGEQEAELLHLRSWEKDVLDGAHNLHFNFQKPYGKLMTKHGFKNIKSVVINSPLGQRTSQEMALERVEPYSLVPLIEGCGWTLTGVQVQNARVKRDIKSHRNYLSLQTIVIYGQK